MDSFLFPKNQMPRRTLIVATLILPATLAAQSPSRAEQRNGVMIAFENIASRFGDRLLMAFDSIPAAQYDYRPTPVQQSVGYIAQHLEDANYSLCERLGTVKHSWTTKDSLADSVKARWPKDTLVSRLRTSLAFCDSAIARLPRLESTTQANALLLFETDLAEHYSQIAVYMRLLGMVPPSALPPKQRTPIELPATTLSAFAGVYQLAPGQEFTVTTRDGALFIQSSLGSAARLWPESGNEFFIKEVDAQITFTKGASGAVTALVLHQYGRDRRAPKIR